MFCAMSFALLCLPTSLRAADKLAELTEISVTSTLDGSQQPSLVWAPETAASQSTPLFVYLHSWSGDYRQNNAAWHKEAVERGWIYLHPNFRGPNNQPEACGSELARRDILDAIEDVIVRYNVDQTRVYLAGASGGGHMTMLMAGYYPQRFSAASAWVGISNLADWYRFHTSDGKRGGYAQMVFQSCGGVPGESDAIDVQYRSRSPIHQLQHAVGLPLELSAGVDDGHKGSVPIAHTLTAFNVVAKASGLGEVSASEIAQLSTDRKLAQPLPGDVSFDKEYGRDILLRRKAGKTRVTIFDGGHEGIAHAGAAWLSRYNRPTRSVKP